MKVTCSYAHICTATIKAYTDGGASQVCSIVDGERERYNLCTNVLCKTQFYHNKHDEVSRVVLQFAGCFFFKVSTSMLLRKMFCVGRLVC